MLIAMRPNYELLYRLKGLGMAGAVLHILALLMWILVIGLGAIGSQAMKQADEAGK